jgi:L-lactate dehydrogenase complex protein LldG
LLPLSEVEFIGTVFADDDAWNALPADLRSSLSRADDVWTADSGLTLVDRAVAETGSLVLSAGGGRARLASLAPPRHVALVREDQIVSSLDEALAGLTGRTSVLISGPSRTADIAGILVRGIHGPKELIVAIY